MQGSRQCLLPPSGSADQPVGNDAEPEVHDQAYVELEWAVARQWKGGREKEVRHVAENDGAQSLEKIDQHRGFRHRLNGGRTTRAGSFAWENSFATSGENPIYWELVGLTDF